MNRPIRIASIVALALLATAAQAHAQRLETVMNRIAGAWRQNNDKAIAALISSDGASIETGSGRLGPLGPRQAAAVLRMLFDERTTQEVSMRKIQEVGGDPPRAYGEVVWVALRPQTTQPTRVVVFVEMALEQDRNWRITRIRLISAE